MDQIREPVRTPLARFVVAALIALGLGLMSPVVFSGQAKADAADVIQSQELNEPGVVGEIIQAKRKEGVLTIKLRLRNTSEKAVSVAKIKSGEYDAYYVTAGNKKYFVLKDTENVPLATPADGASNYAAKIEVGATYVWWAKYPAPPPEVKSISYYTPHAAPFEDIPITD